MKFCANPVIVDAFIVIGTGPINPDGSILCCTSDGKNRRADKAMVSRLIPSEGDYWVVQADGYEYLNPKGVFERKYSLVAE